MQFYHKKNHGKCIADDDEKNAVSVNSLLVQVYIHSVNVGFCCDVPCDVRLKVKQMYALKGRI